jgi:uncharacterized protein with HEPN domain
MSKAEFLADKRSQQAVIMSLIIIGEAVTKVMDRDPAFAARHAQIPWRNMRGMRNRITHGYFDINLEWCGKPFSKRCRSCFLTWRPHVRTLKALAS